MAYGAMTRSLPFEALSSPAAHNLARGLGWMSIGLGLAEVLAPRVMARRMGVPAQHSVFSAYGWREIATGIGILAARNPGPWVWARVAGDALDLATLTNAADRYNPRRGNALIALAAVGGVAVIDVICALSLAARGRGREEVSHFVRDYGRRSGFPRPLEAMRGLARDFFARRGREEPWFEGRRFAEREIVPPFGR